MLSFNNKETIIIQSTDSPSVENLIKRGNFALEDKEWKNANSFFEQALNQNPECVEAYLGKLMVELRVSKKQELSKAKKDFSTSSSWKRILLYADNDLISELSNYLYTVIEKVRIKKESMKKIVKVSVTFSGIIAIIVSIVVLYIYVINPAIRYNKALNLYNDEEYFSAWVQFESLNNYKDSSQKADLSYEMYQKSTWITMGDIVLKTNPNLSKNIRVDNENVIISNYDNYTINEFIELISTVDGSVLDSQFSVIDESKEERIFLNNGSIVLVLRKKTNTSTESNKLTATDISLSPWKKMDVKFAQGLSEIKGCYVKNGETIPFTINVIFE